MRYLQWTIVGILTLFPIVFFVVPKGANTIFYLLLLISLIGLACRFNPMGQSFGRTWRQYWPVNVSMAGIAIAILIHQAATGEFLPKAYDMPSRLAFFPLLFWVCLLVPSTDMKKVEWGWIAGAIVCALTIHVSTSAGIDRPARLYGIPIIPYGNIGMLMGMLAFLSIGWNKSNEKITVALKVLAGAATLYGSYLSQTRGGWAALPIFIAIAFVIPTGVRLRYKILCALSAMALLGSIYAFSDAVQKRVSEAEADISYYVGGKNLNTSLGLRFQLWQAAWLLFKEHPAVGIGEEHYPEFAKQLVKRRVITPEAALHPHSHNELLFHMASLGIAGFLAILSLYFVPAYYFLREIRHADREIRTVAGMGLALIFGFFVFGLTDVMFYWTVSHTFYGIVLALLFAHMVRRKYDLSKQ